jgi:hypothetical protein
MLSYTDITPRNVTYETTSIISVLEFLFFFRLLPRVAIAVTRNDVLGPCHVTNRANAFLAKDMACCNLALGLLLTVILNANHMTEYDWMIGK